MLIAGKDLMAFMAKPDDATTNEEGAKNARSIGASTDHTLTINQSTRPIQHKDKSSGQWAFSDFGILDWSVTASGFICDKQPFIDGDKNSKNTADNVRKGLGMGDIFDAMIARQPVYVCFGIEQNSVDYRNGKLAEPAEDGWSINKNEKATNYLGGYAWITNITESAPVGDYATYSIEFQGNGELERVFEGGVTEYSLKDTPAIPVSTKTTKTNATATAEKA